MKKLKLFILAGVFFLASCMSYHAPVTTKPDNSLCENPRGWEYVCYDTSECREYLNGYAAVFKERYQAQGDGWFTEDGDKQRVDINLFYDHEGIYIIGYIVGTREGDRVWQQVTTWVCDIEGNLVEPPGTLGAWSKWEIK